MKSLSGPTATEHKEPLCNILTCYELLYSWIFIWKIEPHSGLLSRVGHWLYHFVWSWSFLACSFDPAELEGLRGILGAVKNFRVSNFPFYDKPSLKIRHFALPSFAEHWCDVCRQFSCSVLSSGSMAPVKSSPPKKVFRSCIIPVVSVRETEAQTGFRLTITWTVGLCSGAQRILFTLWSLLKEKCYFSAHKILKTLKLVGKDYVTLTGMLFLLMCCLRHLPCWWHDSKSYVRLSAIAQLRVPSFTWERWQISASWAFLSAWLGSIHLLIAGKLKYFYPGLGWGTACWGSASSENRGYLCSVKQLWCSVHPVGLGCSRWNSRNCSTCGSTGLENPNLWGVKADKTKPLIVISLDVVVPKSQSRAHLLGLVDCSERLGSAPAEMGVPQLHCLPNVVAAFWGQGFLIPHICHLSPSALLPPC